jgi:hypothetical protein
LSKRLSEFEPQDEMDQYRDKGLGWNQKTSIWNFHNGKEASGLLDWGLISLTIQTQFTFIAIIVERTELSYGMIT